MQVLCSSHYQSTQDNTDMEGDTINHMFNHIIDEKDGDYCTNSKLSIFPMKNLHKLKGKKFNKRKLAIV